ncbi:hypothetical protein PVK06_014141 [Gossypium arboreum]|uniref:Reverse transcriptase zinc-binding domain-containing protein n=1 Tax=Gossypium arboreum TaxID=29729 RepID=A0ABR0PTZ5_GOSAR|nr:hypothetical protein PVK06_014141 [Gossypium arboreum]
MLGHFICTTLTGCIDETLRVCDFITFDGSWNWQQPVLDCIAVVLPPSQDASFDKIIWQCVPQRVRLFLWVVAASKESASYE